MAIVAKVFIWLIRVYQIGVSPVLGNNCRFPITCSQYGIDSIRKFGILKGSWITFIRILRCHPFVMKDIVFFKHVNIRELMNMDLQRNLFIIAFLIVSCILWQMWDMETNQIVTSSNDVESFDKSFDIKSVISQGSNTTDLYNYHIANHDQIFTVKTDVFLLKINTNGGDIEEAYLTNYLENLNSKKPFHLLKYSKDFKYQMKSGFIINNECLSDYNNYKNKFMYVSADSVPDNNEYIIPKNSDELKLTLIHQDKGISYTKQYIFNRNDYFIRIIHIVNNTNNYPIQFKLFGNLIQSINPMNGSNNDSGEDSFPLYSYRGSAYSTDKEKYQKYSFKDMKRIDLNVHSDNGGWIAMLQKYFVTAWLPTIPKDSTFYSFYNQDDNSVSIGFKSNLVYIPSGESVELKSTLWIGPKLQEKMKLINPNLDLVIDYGWLWFISKPLFKLLQFIHNYVDNWGCSIVLITLIIRLIMYPLTKAQYTSMSKIRMLQPKLASIQELYKYDKYKYHKKTIELYKSEKVNPLGGCLPLLIQMPIFLALYYMLSGSIELRHSRFTLWINDLSAPDPYYILPIIMGLTMFFIQKLSPTTISDPIQKKIMTIMLIVFTIFFLWFPSGLVLYYIASNMITIVQQQIIYHGLSKKGIT